MSERHLADPRKIVYLTADDLVVDHQLQPPNVASTERSTSLVWCQPAREWRLGEKETLPLKPKRREVRARRLSEFQGHHLGLEDLLEAIGFLTDHNW